MLPPKTGSRSALPMPPIAWPNASRCATQGIAHVQVRTADELAKALPDADVLVVSMLWKNELAKIATKLKFIQSISAGIDQYDKEVLRAHGIRLASAAGVNATAVAEHAMALMLALQRKLPEAATTRAPSAGGA